MGIGRNNRTAFTLVELLVVIAVVAVLMAMMMPVLTNARVAARTAICAGNMRQHATMVTQYSTDCKDFLPMPLSPHQADPKYGAGGARLWTKDIASRTGATGGCPLGNGKTWAIGYGWFFWQGYVPENKVLPVVNGKGAKLGIFDDPGAMNFRGMGMSQAQSQETFGGSYSIITPVLAAQNNNINTGSSAWECNADVCYASYIYRGWGRTTAQGTIKNGTPKSQSWSPSDATAVCMEKWDAVSATYQDAHGDGLNVMFFDGHVKFGGKDIAGDSVGIGMAIKPHAYYSMKAGYNYATAIDAYSGYAYPGGTAYTNLWKYYETGIP